MIGLRCFNCDCMITAAHRPNYRMTRKNKETCNVCAAVNCCGADCCDSENADHSSNEHENGWTLEDSDFYTGNLEWVPPTGYVLHVNADHSSNYKEPTPIQEVDVVAVTFEDPVAQSHELKKISYAKHICGFITRSGPCRNRIADGSSQCAAQHPVYK